jgi:hypothetical protein
MAKRQFVYPFRAWPYEKLCSRIDQLIEAGFSNEAIVGAVQSLERGVKRILVYYMNTRYTGFASRRQLDVLSPLSSKEERDQSVRWLQGLDSLRDAWSALVARNGAPRLPAAADAILGNGGWLLLSSAAPFRWKLTPEGQLTPVGLFELRHKLVHGWYLPAGALLRELAPMGAYAVRELLRPGAGLGSLAGFDPFRPIPRFRTRPASVDES